MRAEVCAGRSIKGSPTAGMASSRGAVAAENTHKSCYCLCSTSYGGTDGETLSETGKKAHHSYYNRKKLILIHEDNKNCKDADLL